MSKDTNTPNHVGIVLDGNRRWAKEQGLPTFEGHRAGAEAIEPVLQAAYDEGVEYITLFVFSTENWSRTQDEVGYLMKLFLGYFKKESKRLMDEGIRVKFAGRRDDRVDPKIISAIEELEKDSADNTNGTVVFCFNYGGRAEIVDAVKQLADSGVSPSDVDEDMLSDNMYHPDVPPIDLMIRTSGEQRISGFSLWRSAYAEFLFVDKYWPDFTADDMTAALKEYSMRSRRFGGN
ncbi:MAG: polyprenyl diphosphate synthase [Patescibacteria group bacterium]